MEMSTPTNLAGMQPVQCCDQLYKTWNTLSTHRKSKKHRETASARVARTEVKSPDEQDDGGQKLFLSV
jgi:hypothetical protein